VGGGKPAPDVSVEAARRLEVEPSRSAAVEDSTNGIRSARAAGMRVIAIPNPAYPPQPDALAEADLVLDSIGRLTVEIVESASLARDARADNR
ncbi:MAG: HAD-IA family hydrolase, partial [Actinobacteria bacterium]|nr:HAD-IA family hydrolase [Actinomycetota bacterium]